MGPYTVTVSYTVDEANTPERAALLAYDMMTDPAGLAPIVTVTDEYGHAWDVDIEEIRN